MLKPSKRMPVVGSENEPAVEEMKKVLKNISQNLCGRDKLRDGSER
jgi:hypothetical protein